MSGRTRLARALEPARRSSPRPEAAAPTRIATLQRVLGNRALQRLLQPEAREAPPTSARPLPTRLRSGIEQLSGLPMGDVRVHYGSSEPAKVDAVAFARGDSIHLAPSQDRLLAHEAWHVVQQRQGRVRPNLRVGGQPVNDDRGLEREADRMGARAMRTTGAANLGHATSEERAEPTE